MQEQSGGSVRSEVGRLRAVLVHRPGEELRRITPSNMDELLFDELLWVEHAQQEHDAFADVLEHAGVEVLTLQSLLTDLLSDDDTAAEVVHDQVTAATCGPEAVDAVRGFLLGLTPSELAAHLVSGVTLEEAGAAAGLVAAVTPPTETLLPPLPNAVFARDSSAWIGEGVVVAPMNRLVRRRESALLRLIYRRHPRFAGTPIWFGTDGQDTYPATFEGGDLLVVGARGIAVGLSERTTPSGVESLAVRLFEAEVVDRVLAVDLPKIRSAMHLDTVVSQVDVDAFLVYPSLTHDLTAWMLTPGRAGRLQVSQAPGLMAGLAWAAGLDHARAIEPGLDSVRAEREQWNDANNTLALHPGEVVAYERNVATNAILEHAGITVRTIPSYELPRGRGGPRCMTCPVRRDPLP